MIKEIVKYPTISFFGNKGRGKTVGASILVNNLDRDTLIIDTVGAFTIGRLIREAVYIEVDVRKFNKKTVIGILNRFKIKQKIVLNLQRLTRKEQVLFCEVLFSVVLELGDLAIVIDEVGEIVSQQREYYSPEYERLVRIGRNYKIRPVIQITQRPQKVDKNVLALSDYYFIMGLSHNLDLNAVRELLGFDLNEFKPIRLEIKKLKTGDVLLLKFDGEIQRAYFDMSQDSLIKRYQGVKK